MKNTKIGGTKKKVTNAISMTALIVIFMAYMFPFIMVLINSLKQKRDIIKSPFSWLFTIKGLSFDNFEKAFTQMDFLNAFKKLVYSENPHFMHTSMIPFPVNSIILASSKRSRIM